MFKINSKNKDNQVLFIASYPPRECGIATYSKDLINAVHNKFYSSFAIKVCAIEQGNPIIRAYPDEVEYILRSTNQEAYIKLAQNINNNKAIKMVFIQHEFGLFGGDYGDYLLQLLYNLEKPVSVTFHTVLPSPNKQRKLVVQSIANICDKIVVMTKHSATILHEEYNIPEHKILFIPHGTHGVLWKNKPQIKKRYRLEDRLILSTFGLLSPNKNIETALDALPKIVKQFPNVLYLILGRTHPEVIQQRGEVYRKSLEAKIKKLDLQNNVKFVNKYLELSELLEYLHLTDVYLFTSKDPHQSVSGTFAYAMSSACPVISTPIPHAQEMLQEDTGIIIDFQDPNQLADAAIQLLDDKKLREKMGRNAFHQTRSTVWENTAITHARLFNQYISTGVLENNNNSLTYSLPNIHIKHIHSLTDHIGMIQFSDISHPDINSGYTLDDNARAMIAICMHYDLTREMDDIILINTYLDFIDYCHQPNGNFLNYVDKNEKFHDQNNHTNLEDSNGRAIWSLGILISYQDILPTHLFKKAKEIIDKSLPQISKIESPRSMAFTIKGLYFYYQIDKKETIRDLIEELANKLLKKYNTVSDTNWNWFEEYLTYANSILPEAMLYAYLATNNLSYRMIAHNTFEFLLSHLFDNDSIKVISNNGWHQKGSIPNKYGEQPIDVSYTIQALDLFYQTFKDKTYLNKMGIAFSWFLGNNHLHQIIYNPLSGGCYDGLEEHGVNLNQGAESTVCYLTARLIMEKNRNLSINQLFEDELKTDMIKHLSEKKPRSILNKRKLVYSTKWPLYGRHQK